MIDTAPHGAAIWNMGEALPPAKVSRWGKGRYREKLAGGERAMFRRRAIRNGTWATQPPDPEGFVVLGRYPKGFLRHVVKLRLLGDVRRDEILHVCSGTLGPYERLTVDVRLEARPWVVADGRHLPFADSTFKAVMMDPPYSETYARELYGTDNPRPSHLLREAARVVVPGGRIGILHVAVPFAPPRNAFRESLRREHRGWLQDPRLHDLRERPAGPAAVSADTKPVRCPICRELHPGRKHKGFLLVTCPKLNDEQWLAGPGVPEPTTPPPRRSRP